MAAGYCLLVGCLTFTSLRIQPAEQCAPVKLLSSKLKRAEYRMLDGRIVLNMTNITAVTPRIPTCSGKRMPAILIRGQLGHTVALNCTTAECAIDGDSAACAESTADLYWLHGRYSVWHAQNNVTNRTSPFTYTVFNTSTMAHLLIHNITADAAGHVDCLRERVRPDEEYCTVALYDLRPFLTASDLLSISSQQVTIQVGRDVVLRCDLRFPLYKYVTHRYMWRYNGQFAMAPDSHPLSGLIKPVVPYTSRFHYNETYTSLSLFKVATSVSGKYECWVLPYFQVDEWIVGVIHLHVV